MGVRLLMRTKLWESVMIIVAAYLLSHANGSSHDCLYSRSTAVSCIHKNLVAVPDWIPSNVTKIDLSFNPVLKVQEDTFARFTSLQSLTLRRCNLNQSLQLPESLLFIDLSDNPILKPQEDSFVGLTNLQFLRLRHCNLSQPLQLPKSLQRVDLSHNPFLKSQEDSFVGLTNLQFLRLRHCNLSQPLQLPKSLQRVDLSHNPFLKSQEDSFVGLTNLQFLRLRHCNLSQPLQLPKSLQRVDLSHNPFLKSQEDSFVGLTNLQFLRLRHCNLSQPLQLPKSLQRVDLSHNPFLKSQEDSFVGLTSLRYLYLRRCNLSQPRQLPKSLLYIDLSFNAHLMPQEDSFVGLTNLRFLYLRRCNLNQPLQLPKSLQYIDLEGNSFTMESVAKLFKQIQQPRIQMVHLGANNLTLDGNLSVFPKSVKRLYLNKNMLRKIQVDDFKGFSHLKTLDLRNSNLHSIAAGALDHLKDLNTIMLSDNNIMDLPKRLFQHNPKVSVISLDNNHLRHIPDFTGIYHRAISLSLSRNRIKTVHSSNFRVRDAFSINLSSNKIHSFNLSGLTYRILDISNNCISRIEQGSLGENSNIDTLLLHRNNITLLTRTCFQGIYSIEELHLQSNKLQWIEKGTFWNMRINNLLLSNNSLTTMNGAMQGMTRQPQLLVLFGNPHINLMRASDYGNMTSDSKIYIDCRSIKAFSSPFIMKAKLICSSYKELVITSYAGGLNGNGFACKEYQGSLQSKCHPCQPGEYDATVDKGQKRYFPSHKIDNKGQHCTPCPYGGFYQDELASIDCKKCPVGQYVPPDKGPGKSPLDCLTCPMGTNTDASAGYRACRCLPGYSRKYRFGACKKCAQDGFQCNRDYPELRQGYWMSWDNSETCRDSFKSFMSNLDTQDDTYDRKANYFNCTLPIAHKCPIPKSCKGGVDATCYKGYSRVLCAVCDSGYMKQFNKCVKCPSPVVSVIDCIAYLLLFLILCWLMSKLKNITLVGKHEKKNERTFADLIQSSLKILMGFYQVLVRIINAFSSIQWPSSFTHAVTVFEFIQLSVLRIPSLHCIRSHWRLSAIGEFWISLIAMAAIPSLVLIYFALKTLISFYCVSRENFRQKRMISLKNCLQSIVLFFFATYPFISTKIFNVLPGSCHTICTVMENGHCLNKMYHLRNDYSVECPHTTGDRGFNVNYAYVSLLLPIGLPCLLLYLLWKFARKQNGESQPQRHLSIQSEDSLENEEQCYVEWEGYNASSANCKVVDHDEYSVAEFALKMTYGNYKTSCWYWEFIEMIRKLVMIIASSFFLQDLKIGLYNNILLSIVFVILHVKIWPMKDSFDNYMQLLALVSVTVNLCYSVTKASSIGDEDIIDNEKDVFGLGLMLVCLNSLVVILIVGRFIKEVVVKLMQKNFAGCCWVCCSLQCCNLHSVDGIQEVLL